MVALVMAAGGLVVMPASPSVSAETCRGEVATHVGSVGAQVEGTEGHDVVVTKGARHVRTLGGDDVVCVTLDDDGRAAGNPMIETGAGDDVVQTFDLTPNNFPQSYLGDGADTYVGGPHGESVQTADRLDDLDWDRFTVADDDPDVVRTFGGNDRVDAGAIDAVEDQIDLGADGGRLHFTGVRLGGDGRIALGSGSFVQFLRSEDDRTWEVDTAARTARRAGEANGVTWTGRAAAVEVYGDVPVRFRGTAGPDEVIAAELVDASMGGGADRVTTFPRESVHRRQLSGGAGHDVLTLAGEYDADEAIPTTADLDVDAGTGVVSFAPTSGGQRFARVRSSGFDRFVATSFRDVEMRGSAGPDELEVDYADRAVTLFGGAGDDLVRHDATGPVFISPRIRLVGGTGRDRIANVFHGGRIEGGPGADSITGAGGRIEGGPGPDSITGSPDRETVLGGEGDDVVRAGPADDRLYGQTGNDVLNGGSGNDRADGGPGRDRCQAERRTGCER